MLSTFAQTSSTAAKRRKASLRVELPPQRWLPRSPTTRGDCSSLRIRVNSTTTARNDAAADAAASSGNSLSVARAASAIFGPTPDDEVLFFYDGLTWTPEMEAERVDEPADFSLYAWLSKQLERASTRRSAPFEPPNTWLHVNSSLSTPRKTVLPRHPSMAITTKHVFEAADWIPLTPPASATASSFATFIEESVPLAKTSSPFCAPSTPDSMPHSWSAMDSDDTDWSPLSAHQLHTMRLSRNNSACIRM
ncbi:hypothetical protein BKA62DRAFT_705831, partial [Auriculariales sp. MPI-PUGE-AT-0066]